MGTPYAKDMVRQFNLRRKLTTSFSSHQIVAWQQIHRSFEHCLRRQTELLTDTPTFDISQPESRPSKIWSNNRCDAQKRAVRQPSDQLIGKPLYCRLKKDSIIVARQTLKNLMADNVSLVKIDRNMLVHQIGENSSTLSHQNDANSISNSLHEALAFLLFGHIGQK